MAILTAEQRRSYFEEVIHFSEQPENVKQAKRDLIATKGLPEDFRTATRRGAGMVGVLLAIPRRSWRIDLERNGYFIESVPMRVGLTPEFLPCRFIPALDREDERHLCGVRFSEIHMFGRVPFDLYRHALWRLEDPDNIKLVRRVM